MNKYEDEGLVRNRRIQVLLTEDEHERLSIYRQTSRAPSLSYAARELLLSGLKTYSKHTQNIVGFEESNNERKESSKEKEENTKNELKTNNNNASAREEIIGWLCDNEETMRTLCMREKIEVSEPRDAPALIEALRPYMDEFINGLVASGTDLYLMTRTDTKYHFSNWLRKYIKLNDDGRKTDDHRGIGNGSVDAGADVQKPTYTVDWEAVKLRHNLT